MVVRPVLVVLALAACSDPAAAPDAGADSPYYVGDGGIDADPNKPQTLAETGLCLDAACTQIASTAIPYTPQFELWSDGATKKRWIYLPPDTKIDTTDMDFWQFPVGTKLWKEFTRGTTRVETRLISRIGPGTTKNDWFYAAYVWNADQNATTLEDFGVTDANGTEHDVPSRFMCQGCHENLPPSRVLGIGAIQMDHGTTNPDSDLDLGKLVADNRLTAPPSNAVDNNGRYFPMPETSTQPNAGPALGYMHANCGHCHNPYSLVYANTAMVLRLTTGSLGSLATTPPYMSAVNKNGSPIDNRTKIVVPGSPDTSIMTYRFESTNPAEFMPALGREIMDPDGAAKLRAWITNIQ